MKMGKTGYTHTGCMSESLGVACTWTMRNLGLHIGSTPHPTIWSLGLSLPARLNTSTMRQFDGRT